MLTTKIKTAEYLVERKKVRTFAAHNVELQQVTINN